MPILDMTKLRLREIQLLAQGFTAKKRQGQALTQVP